MYKNNIFLCPLCRKDITELINDHGDGDGDGDTYDDDTYDEPCEHYDCVNDNSTNRLPYPITDLDGVIRLSIAGISWETKATDGKCLHSISRRYISNQHT
jgi:hypothetical protein